MKLGSLGWGRATQGRLSLADRLVFAAQAVEAIARARWRRKRSPALPVMLSPIPASPHALAATAFCESVSEPWLVNHCTRTFVWATLLAQRDGLTFDAELLHVSCMLHDLGLSKVRARRPEACFAVAGAEEAAAFASEKLRWDDRRCALLAEAISLHLNLIVAEGEGVEAHLLHEGAGFDVVGARLRQVPKPLRSEVLSTHPRLEQNARLSEVCAREADAHPDTRLGFSFRRFGARSRIEACARLHRSRTPWCRPVACKWPYRSRTQHSTGASERSQLLFRAKPTPRIEWWNRSGAPLAESPVMSTKTFDFGSQLERLMNDRRIRIAGLIAGAVIISTSLIVANVANDPANARSTKTIAVLPDSPLNIPIIRQWPYAHARQVEAVTVRAPASKPAKRVFTARR